MWLCAQRLRRKKEEERKRSSRLDKMKDIKRRSEEWWLWEHIALAPSVGQIRQKPTTSSLSARTPMVGRDTIVKHDKPVWQERYSNCYPAVWRIISSAQNESVMLTVAQGQRTPYLVNSLKNMCVCLCVCAVAVVAAVPLTNGLIRTGDVHMCSSWTLSSYLSSR